MGRSSSYNTKQSRAVLDYLKTVKSAFVTVSQIVGHLRTEQVVISRATVYRQLEKLIKDGKVRKHILTGSTVSSFQYIEPSEYGQSSYCMECEVCSGVFNLKCDEVDHVSKHIWEEHAFQVNGSKTVFYGRCNACMGGPQSRL